jgi:hypothetical protein
MRKLLFVLLAALTIVSLSVAPASAQTHIRMGHWRKCGLLPSPCTQHWLDAMNEAERNYGSFQGHWRNYHDSTSNVPLNADELTALDAGHRLFVNWKPGGTWASTAQGAVDSQLHAVAHNMQAACSTKSFGACWITFWHEPEDNIGASGSGMTAADYVAMWRHVASIFMADAPSVLRVWTIMGWNQTILPSLWPGDQYVQLVGQDPYEGYLDAPNVLANKMVNRLRWFRDTDSSLHHWGPQSKRQVFPEYGCSLFGNDTADHTAACLKAVQAVLSTLVTLNLAEMDYFDARGDALAFPPSPDGAAYKTLKDTADHYYG